MATWDGDDHDEAVPAKHKPVVLQIFETTVFAVKKPLKVALSLVAGVFSLRFFAAFLQVVLEVHAEHEHIAPGWLGKRPISSRGFVVSKSCIPCCVLVYAEETSRN